MPIFSSGDRLWLRELYRMFSRLSIRAWLTPYAVPAPREKSSPARDIRYIVNMFLTLLIAKRIDLPYPLERKYSGMVIAGAGKWGMSRRARRA
jgi:hypothetical protein